MGVSIRPEPPQRRTRLEELAGVGEPQPEPQQPTGEGLSKLERLAAGLPVEGEPAHGKAASFLGGLGQGTTFGFADEILAGLEALDKRQPYSEALETVRAKMQGLREANPGTHLVGELAGGVVIPAGAAAKATTLGGKAAVGAATGAVGGAVGGAGAAEGDLLDRGKGALIGGAVGGAVGGLGVPVVAGAARLGRAVMDVSGLRPRPGIPGTAVAPRTGAIGDIAESVTPRSTSERAADKLLEAVDDDKLSLDQIRAEMGERASSPKPETINEFGGRNVRGLTETVNTIPGPSREMLESRLVTGRIGERLGDDNPLLSRVRANTEEAFGLKAGSTLEAVEDIEAAMRTDASPFYDKAFAAGSLLDERLPALLKRPSVKRGLKYAKELAEEAGETFKLPDRGAPISIRSLHHIKLALDDAISASRLDTSKGPTMRGEMIRTRDAIREILHTNDDYRQGAQLWAGRSALRDAVETGEQMFTEGKVRAEDVRRAMKDLTDSERTMFLQGAVNAVHRAVGDPTDARNIVEKIAGSPNLREKMQAVLGKDYEKWIRNMRREDAIYQTRNESLRGSQTAGRLAGQDRLADIGRTKPNELFKFSHWGGRAVEGLRNRQTSAMAESLGPLLTAGTEGSEMGMEGLMRELAAAEARRAAQATRQAGTAGRAGRVAGQQAGGRQP